MNSRIVARSVELGSRALQAQGHVMLGLVFMLAGDRASAETEAAAAEEWFAALASPYAWACAQTLAWARASSRPLEAREILARALPVWERTGRYWIGGSRALETLATFDQAGLAPRGTILLDEVGELAPDDQVRLLRVLQEGTFERVGGSRTLRADFRLVAATNRDLATEVRLGRFREDLYFRLAAFPIRVPPLRERAEEIPTLALFFMERVSRRLGLRFDGISERDMERLTRYAWPGNVRELDHVIERAALLSDPPRLRIPPLEGTGLRAATGARDAETRVDEWVSLEEAQRRYVRRVLHHVHGRVSGPGGAAEVLKLKPSTLQFRIDRLHLRDELAQARRARRHT